MCSYVYLDNMAGSYIPLCGQPYSDIHCSHLPPGRPRPLYRSVPGNHSLREENGIFLRLFLEKLFIFLKFFFLIRQHESIKIYFEHFGNDCINVNKNILLIRLQPVCLMII